MQWIQYRKSCGGSRRAPCDLTCTLTVQAGVEEHQAYLPGGRRKEFEEKPTFALEGGGLFSEGDDE